MTDKKRKVALDDSDIDLEGEYGINQEDLKDIISMNEQGNVFILRHKMKQVDEAVEKIEDGLYDILFIIDDIVSQYEEGKIFKRDCGQAVEQLFTLASFTNKMEKEFSELKNFKDTI